MKKTVLRFLLFTALCLACAMGTFQATQNVAKPLPAKTQAVAEYNIVNDSLKEPVVADPGATTARYAELKKELAPYHKAQNARRWAVLFMIASGIASLVFAIMATVQFNILRNNIKDRPLRWKAEVEKVADLATTSNQRSLFQAIVALDKPLNTEGQASLNRWHQLRMHQQTLANLPHHPEKTKLTQETSQAIVIEEKTLLNCIYDEAAQHTRAIVGTITETELTNPTAALIQA